MGFTFDPALATDKDKVRFKIGDTEDTAPAVEDETITALLSGGSSVLSASIDITRALIAKYSRLVDKEIGPLRIDHSDRVKNYQRLLNELQEERDRDQTPGVYAGGYLKSVRDANDEDDDVIQLLVEIDMHKNTE